MNVSLNFQDTRLRVFYINREVVEAAMRIHGLTFLGATRWAKRYANAKKIKFTRYIPLPTAADTDSSGGGE